MMRGLHRIFLAVYFPVLLLYLLASFTMYVHPETWWPAGFLALIHPFLFLLTIVLTITSITIRFRYIWVGLMALLLSFSSVSNMLPFSVGNTFLVRKQAGTIRVMSWNIRRFTPYYLNHFDPEKNQVEGILEEIRRYDPDVLCLQEFYTSKRPNGRTMDKIRAMGYPYMAFARQRHFRELTIEEGNIIFSKYPILRWHGFEEARRLSQGWDEPVFAEIQTGEDTLRVGTFHMESYGFVQRDYEDLAKIRYQQDEDLRASRHIFGKMRYAFQQRGRQADLISGQVTNSSLPVILCGDLNDVPASYSYRIVKGELNDAFLEKGSGLGKTFVSGRSRVLTWLPTLRIDYIFSDDRLGVRQITRTTGGLSDHRGLIADIELPKKQ
jgi:endonuclease/exonuclease/phosphatase family metal-dependent hydrolase